MFFLFDIIEKTVCLQSGFLHEVVVHVEGDAREDDDEKENWLDSSKQGNTSAFDRRQLEMFSEVSESDERRQQYRKGHGYWRHKDGKVKQELAEHVPAETFSDDIVKVLQHVLGEKNKHHDEEGHDKGTCERTEDEFIDLFQAAVI